MHPTKHASLTHRLLQWILARASHPKAPTLLAGISFAEASFFPIPPDLLLIPMSLAHPSRVWRYAGLATIFSVLGGILGYFLGLWFYQILAAPLLEFYGVEEEYSHAVSWFETYGVWVVFLAGITPIPYKVFTIGAGSLQMAWLPFLVASTLGRGVRFFALAGTLYWGGEWLLRQVERWGPALFWVGILALAGMVIHSFFLAD